MKKRFMKEAGKTGFVHKQGEMQQIHLGRDELDGTASSMVHYSILPGIDLVYNSFNSENGAEVQYTVAEKRVIELNYCAQGRYGCVLNGKEMYLGEGELEAHLWGLPKSDGKFPLGVYKGISLLIDPAVARRKIPELFPEIGLQLDNLLRELKRCEGAVKIVATPEILEIFQSMYQVQPDLKLFYLRIKLLELLMYIKTVPIADCGPKQYVRRRDFTKIKNIYQEVVINLDKHYSLAELADKYQMGRTTLQRCFKEVYGKPYYTFLKQYKMHQAIHFLEEGKMNITEIAGKLGYGNVSKFSAAFKSVYGYSPNEYKK